MPIFAPFCAFKACNSPQAAQSVLFLTLLPECTETEQTLSVLNPRPPPIAVTNEPWLLGPFSGPHIPAL